MSDSTAPKDIYDCVIESSAQMVSGLGFFRRGATLRKISDGNAAIIEFQKSSKSGHHDLLFTVNLGIVCGELIEEDQPPLARAGSINAHLRQRIGMLLPDRSDKWWQIAQGTDKGSLVTEVSSLIFYEAAPYLERHLDTNALVALWESGKSPGLTETQRMRYLAKINTVKASAT